ncbi:MAG TPA: uroporphyrinogen-III synthase [Acidimicrobiales bacterium]|nr:uroporphyrinogen-III synthase [Acidimicrobiales bacterium]
MEDGPLRGLTIGITAERRAAEQADLFRRRGADTLHGPTLRIESSSSGDEALRAATFAVIERPPDYLLASTGFGMRTWFAAADGWGARDALVAALATAKVANRGAKAASANTAAGLAEWYRAPDERWEELVVRVLQEPLDGRRVVLQSHGHPMPKTAGRLEEAGASVVEVDAYSSRLPADTAPAEALIDAACDHRLAAVTFTTAPAVHNLFAIASRSGRADELRAALNGPIVAGCVGPVCAEGAVEEGVASPVVPDRARLVPLVEAVTDHLARVRPAFGEAGSRGGPPYRSR